MGRCACLLALFVAFSGNVAMAIETPKFDLVGKDHDFELRDYAPRVVAETEVAGSREEAGTEGFRRLAGYIFGGNRAGRSIAMTAPVAQTEGQRIAMTAPVAETESAQPGAYVVQFTMPSEWTLDTLPVPNDARVHLREVPAKRVAVLRYSGTWSESRLAMHVQELEGVLAKQGLRAVGPPTWARYDPPWKPWFLRHNEVQIEVAAGAP